MYVGLFFLGIGSRFGWSWVSMFLSFSWNLSANQRAEAQQSVSAGTSILEAPFVFHTFIEPAFGPLCTPIGQDESALQPLMP